MVNIPRVIGKKDYKRFFDTVKEALDILTGKNRKMKWDRAVTWRDLERLGIDLDEFEKASKQNPYTL